MTHDDFLQRLQLIEAEPLAIAADALVVEDDGRLQAARGLAAQIDDLHPELWSQREQAVAQHGEPLPLGAVVPCRASGDQPPHTLLWAVTWTPPHADEVPATPLVIEAVTRRALEAAVERRALHVAMPALGTRIGQFALPPVPKKLPRYVMGAAQLIGIRAALEAHADLRVTVCLTHRDLAIWQTLLGQAMDDEA